MRDINKTYSISEFPTQLVIASRLISIVNRIIEGGQILIAREKKASAEARLNVYYKKRMQKQLHQDTINPMPLEMKLRMGFHRS
jgi:hypothetical protein